MLSFCTTVCRPLTAQIDDHTPICISVFLIFHLPRDHMYRGLKNNNLIYIAPACRMTSEALIYVVN